MRRGSRPALSGELIPAAEAERLGIVSRVVPAERLGAAVDERIDTLSLAAPREGVPSHVE